MTDRLQGVVWVGALNVCLLLILNFTSFIRSIFDNWRSLYLFHFLLFLFFVEMHTKYFSFFQAGKKHKNAKNRENHFPLLCVFLSSDQLLIDRISWIWSIHRYKLLYSRWYCDSIVSEVDTSMPIFKKIASQFSSSVYRIPSCFSTWRWLKNWRVMTDFICYYPWSG